jgi:hypothetical protein
MFGATWIADAVAAKGHTVARRVIFEFILRSLLEIPEVKLSGQPSN